MRPQWRHLYLSLVGILVLSLAVCVPAGVLPDAVETVFELDPARSRAHVVLTALLHTVQGTFRVTRGHLRLHTASGAVSGECVVDATSGDSDNPTRDRKMHAEVLESQRYPEIVFVPLQVRGQVVPEGASTVEVDGTFTLHGASHPLTITAVVRTTGEHFTVSSSFRVPYVQWGMRDPGTFILPVGKQVKILFEAAGHIRR